MCFKMSVYVWNEKLNLSLPFSYSQYYSGSAVQSAEKFLPYQWKTE
jgi:hypothetical protein